MKLQWKTPAVCIALPLAAGGLAAALTRDGMKTFASLNQPPLSPPGWLFPVVWTALYVLMGAASYLVIVSGRPNRTALLSYAVQLAFNFIWPFIFFGGLYAAAFVWLLALWLLVFCTAALFRRVSVPAGRLMLPYLAWVSFAGYLNLAIALLN